MFAALKWGAIAGVVTYLVEVVLALLENALTGSGPLDLTAHPAQIIPVCLSFFALLFAFSAAGFYTGRETGRAGLGAAAGVVTLIVQYLLGLVYSPARGAATTPAARQPALNPLSAFLAAIVAPLILIGIAAFLGWLGGRPGAQRHARRAPPSGTTTQPSPSETPPPQSIQPGGTQSDDW